MKVTIIRYQLIVLLLAAFCGCAQRTVSQNTSAPDSYGLWAVDMSADDKYIALGGDDSLLKIYTGDLELYKWEKLPEGMIKNLRWHPKENILGIATRTSIWIMDVETGQKIELEGKPDGARAIGWNHNGELFAAAAGRGLVWIWNKQGKLLRQIQKTTESGQKDVKDFITMDWHPSKNILIAGGDEIRIYDTSGRQLNMFKHRERQTLLLTARWHPSGDFFITGDYGHESEGIPTLLRFWKPDGTLIREIKDSKEEMRNASWSRDGQQLATASDALRIRNKEGIVSATGNNEGIVVWGVDWNSRADKIVTVSNGMKGKEGKGSIRLWSADGRMLRSIQ